MLYRIYLHIMNQNNHNRLDLDQIVIGDCVIIKLKRFPMGNEYYGILYGIDAKNINIVGKPLSWVLNGDLQLDKYTFATYSIDEIKLYTRDASVAARAKADELLRNERLNLLIQNPQF